MEDLISTVLLTGVLASAGLILAGWIWSWSASGPGSLETGLPRGSLFRVLGQEAGRLVHGNFRPSTLVNWGIILLFLTPYARVLLSFLFFVGVDRNRKYAALAGFVLVILTCSLALL